jgi:IMP dehydrogenase/GMP reductase
MKEFHNFTRKVREKWPKSILIAGNVVTPEGVEALSAVGADLIKVGIGSGSMCLTRRVAGVGYPQLSAVLECAETADQLGIGIVADGGINYHLSLEQHSSWLVGYLLAMMNVVEKFVIRSTESSECCIME